MNILFIGTTRFVPQYGGIERVTDVLARGLKAKGNNVYYLYASEIDFSEAFDSPAEEFCMPVKKAYSYGGLEIAFYWALQQKLEIDILVFQRGVLDQRYFFLENAFPSVKKICAVHTTALHRAQHLAVALESVQSGIKNRIWSRMWRIAPSITEKISLKKLQKAYKRYSKSADKIVFLSPSYVRQVNSLFNIPADKLTFIPNSCGYFDESIDWEKKENILLFVGRVTAAEKNPLAFVKIWEILARNNQDWKAILVGDGEAKASLEQYIAENSIPRIELVGQKNPAPYYQKAKFLCLTSNYEPFGNVILEGMCFGCIPCAFDTANAVKDIFTDASEGVIVKGVDIPAYAQRMQEIIDDPNHLDAMAKRAYDRSSTFTPEKIVAQWIALFEELKGKE